MTNRIEVLQNSLKKKKENLDTFFEDLYSHQRLTNGQYERQTQRQLMV